MTERDSQASPEETEEAEKALHDLSSRYEAILAAIPDIILLVDRQLRIERINRSVAGGPGPEELIGADAIAILPESARELAKSKILECFSTGRRQEFEHELVKNRYVQARLVPIARDGAVEQVLIVSTEITALKQAETAQEKATQRAQVLLDLLQRSFASEVELMAFAVDHLVKLTESNLGFIGFIDRSETIMSATVWSAMAMKECAVDGQPVRFDLRSGGLWAEAARTHKTLIVNDYSRARPGKKGCPPGHVDLARFLGVPLIRDGRTVFMAGLANKAEEYDESDSVQATLFLEGIWELVGRRRAEAERKELSEQLRASQKLEAIGHLAGGIAHDFNNMLAVIMNYAEFALENVREGDPLRDDLQQIRSAGQRASALTHQLLAFSRKQVLQLRPVDLNQTIAGMDKMLRRIIGEDIELRNVFAPDLGLVAGDPSQLEQAIMNLVVNARDAMPEGGRLIIETANVQLDDEYAARHVAVNPGAYVMLAVTDTGCGMDEATRVRVFEPFFTLKGQKGSGLGLSTAYGIVKQSGGNIWVYSELGKGTSFKIYLPRTTAKAEPKTALTSAGKSKGGSETILLVEDEAAVRNLAKRILVSLGYSVLVAANGGEALLLCEQCQKEIHLLLTDVVMPHMGGKALSERLAQVCPSVRVLFMSGYTDDAIVHHGVLEPGTQFIAKPFSAEDLARKVREVLDAPSSSSPPSRTSET